MALINPAGVSASRSSRREEGCLRKKSLLNTAELVLMMLPDILFGLFLHLSFSCRDIAPAFTDAIVPKK
jgi:hypothetical protein